MEEEKVADGVSNISLEPFELVVWRRLKAAAEMQDSMGCFSGRIA